MVSRLIKSGIGPRLRALIPSSSLDRGGHGVGPRVPVTVLSVSVRPSDPIRCAFVVRRVTRPSFSLLPPPSSFPDVRRILRTATDVALDRRNLCSHCVVAGRIEDAVKREGEPALPLTRELSMTTICNIKCEFERRYVDTLLCMAISLNAFKRHLHPLSFDFSVAGL